MKAIVTKPFLGAEDGKVYPRGFEPGDVISGELAALAIAGGQARAAGAGAEVEATGAAAGGDPEEGGAEAGSAQDATGGADGSTVDIPEDWESLSWPQMRSLAAKVSAGSIANKEDAVAAIRAALQARAKG